MKDAPPAVLQVLPRLVTGGVERGTIEIAEAIVRAGGRALVASAGGPMVAQLEAVGARHIELPMAGKSVGALFGNARALADVIRAEGVGIVHARSRFPAWSAMMAARRTGAHFITTYHGAYNEGFPGKRLYNSVMARGERVIAISEYIAGLIRARHRVPPERIRLIPRGVDERRFDPALVSPERVEALRAAWGVPEGRPVLVLPGRVTRWKGQMVLVEAMVRLRGAGVPLPYALPYVLIVGDTDARREFRGELERAIAAAGLGADIKLTGHCDDLPAAFLLADYALHCSTDAEAFGRTVIEAQAMGCPVIASDLGGPRETVADGRTGWLVPPGDPAALAGAIGAALAQPAEMRAAMGEAGRRLVLERYTTRAMQEATLAVYREFEPGL
ncbi:glycosyltransferase family 4 protein [Acetobacteraceae bacterium H6797]|nr:glycosyltransferase family 4 protein [Acetobacteraceae bacterium H6797]